MNSRNRYANVLLTGILSLLSVGSANAMMDGFLKGISSFNNVAQGVNKFVNSNTGKAVFKVADSVGKLAKKEVNSKEKKKKDKKARAEYFKETDFYVNKNGNICIFRDGQLMTLSSKKLDIGTLIENNVYTLNKKNFIYTTNDAIDPTVGHFKPVVFEEGKFYYKNGLLYQFINEQLVKYDVAMGEIPGNDTITTHVTTELQKQLPKTTAPILTNEIRTVTPLTTNSAIMQGVTPMSTPPNQPQVANSASLTTTEKEQQRLNTIKTLLKNTFSLAEKTKAINLGRININNINSNECQLIVKALAQFKAQKPSVIKNVIIFVTNSHDKSRTYLDVFRKFCVTNGINLQLITRTEVRNYIYNQILGKNSVKNIDLTKIDISDLTYNETLFMRCCAIEVLVKRAKNAPTLTGKLVLIMHLLKDGNNRQNNLKLIKDFANTYKNYVVIKITTPNGTTIL